MKSTNKRAQCKHTRCKSDQQNNSDTERQEMEEAPSPHTRGLAIKPTCGCGIKDRKIIASGNWLQLENINYHDHEAKERNWESVSRKHTSGAVVIVATLKPSNEILLVRQFRPPTHNYVIEFPAGLIDSGESPEVAAIRELKEETGYSGEIVKILPTAYSSPGLSSETVTVIYMEIDELTEENQLLETNFDDGEDVETFKVAKEDIFKFLESRRALKDVMDAKVIIYSSMI